MDDNLEKVLRCRRIRSSCLRDGLSPLLFYSEESRLISEIGQAEYQRCLREISAYNSRKSRLRQRVSAMIVSGPCLFLTFTWNNESMVSSTPATRKRAVKKFLGSYSDSFVANIDFGRLNCREHYHAIIRVDSVDPKRWIYGNLDFERVKNISESTAGRMSTYVTQLAGHSIKDSAGGIIYSRKKRMKEVSLSEFVEFLSQGKD